MASQNLLPLESSSVLLTQRNVSSIKSNILTLLVIKSLINSVHSLGIVFLNILVGISLIHFRLLMNQRETNIVFKLCDREVQL